MKRINGFAKMAVTIALMGLVVAGLSGCGSKVEWTISGVARWGGTDGAAVGVPVTLGDASTATGADGSFTLSGMANSSQLQGVLVIGGDMAVEVRESVALATTVTLTEPIVLKKIYYVAANGNDDDDGSKLHPFETILKAMQMPEWRRVQLAPGSYGQFFTLNMFDHCEIVGDPDAPESYIITPTGTDSILYGNADDFRISGVTFDFGLANKIAVQVFSGGQGTFDNCIFNITDQTAIGLSVLGGSTLSMTDCTITGGSIGIRAWDYVITSRTVVSLERVTITGCTNGVAAESVSGASYDIDVTNCSLTENICGISFSGIGSSNSLGTLKVSGSTISNNNYGIRVFGGQIDLGGTVPGGNTFTNNAIYSLEDARPADKGVLNAIGNTWGTALSGTIAGPASLGTHYNIVNSGNSIVFSN